MPSPLQVMAKRRQLVGGSISDKWVHFGQTFIVGDDAICYFIDPPDLLSSVGRRDARTPNLSSLVVF